MLPGPGNKALQAVLQLHAGSQQNHVGSARTLVVVAVRVSTPDHQQTLPQLTHQIGRSSQYSGWSSQPLQLTSVEVRCGE